MARTSGSTRWPPVLVALAVVALHLSLAGRYGYFRDELYYLAAARHLAWGYVDFPVGIAAIAEVVQRTLGSSLLALHLLPALAHGGMVLLAAAIARELRGGTFAQLLASLAVAVAPAFLGSGSLLTMDVFDQLLWTAAAAAAVLALQRDRPRLWLLFGALAALGLLLKVTMLFFGAALLAGLLASEHGRRHLRTPWPWAAGLLALVGLVPYVAWNAAHGYPTLAFYARYRLDQAVAGPSATGFAVQQILLASLFSLPVWLGGLAFYLLAPAGRAVRAIGWAFLPLFVLFAATHAKPYFLLELYPALFAAGAVWWEGRLAGARRAILAALVVLGGVLLAPVVLPVLPADAAAAYAAPLHVGVYTPRGDNPLVQPMADRFGWPGLVATMARAYAALPLDQRAQACLLTGNYGEAAAIDFFGPAAGLPPAISPHNNYYLWGPRGCSGAVVLSVGMPPAALRQEFGSVRQVAVTRCAHCVPQENGQPVYLDQAPRLPLTKVWSTWRDFS